MTRSTSVLLLIIFMVLTSSLNIKSSSPYLAELDSPDTVSFRHNINDDPNETQWLGLTGTQGVAIGDYDNDNLNETAITEGPLGKVIVCRSDGTTIEKQLIGLDSPYGVAIGDYNNDGLNELAFTEVDKLTIVPEFLLFTTILAFLATTLVFTIIRKKKSRTRSCRSVHPILILFYQYRSTKHSRD